MSFLHQRIVRADTRVVWLLSLSLVLSVTGSIILLAMVVGAPILGLYLGLLTVALLALSVALL